jgi:hypothetical protein
MKRQTKATDTPRHTPDDKLRVTTRPHPFAFNKHKKDPLARLIVDVVNKMGAFGEDAEELYRAALDHLRHSSRKVVKIIVDELADLPAEQYLDRWSLVQLLAELRDPASLRALDSILDSKIPPETSSDLHSFSSVGEEVMIRTTAVEALTRMAANGNTHALALLLKHTRHPNFSVKRAAVQGYLAHGGPNARKELRRVMPTEDYHILRIQRVDVRDVPQAHGGLHLVCRDAQDDGPPLLPHRPRRPGKA